MRTKCKITDEGRECSNCHAVLPWSDFFNQKHGTRGKYTQCKKCITLKQSGYHKQWMKCHPEIAEKDRELYRQRHPERVKLQEKTRAYRWKAKHPERVKEIRRNWARKHPEYGREVSRQRNNLKRAQSSGVNYKTWCMLFKKSDTFVCYWCGRLTSIQQLHFDHRMPLRQGGVDGLENIVPSCASCNISKSDLTPDEWFALGGPKFKRASGD